MRKDQLDYAKKFWNDVKSGDAQIVDETLKPIDSTTKNFLIKTSELFESNTKND